jgi:hypothetical protein
MASPDGGGAVDVDFHVHGFSLKVSRKQLQVHDPDDWQRAKPPFAPLC